MRNLFLPLFAKCLLNMTIKYIIQSKKSNATISVYLSVKRGKFFKKKTNETANALHWNNKRGAFKNLTALSVEDSERIKTTTNTLNCLKAFLYSEVSKTPTEEINSNFLALKIFEFYNGKTDLNNFFEFLKDFENNHLPNTGMNPVREQRFKKLCNQLRECFKDDLNILKVSEFSTPQLMRFKEFLTDLGYNENTTIERLYMVKFILKTARKKNILVSDEVINFKAKTKQTATPFLTLEELAKIKDLPLRDTELIRARDWLFVGCFTGQRISDFIKFSADRITEIKGRQFLSVKQQKTATNVLIPIHTEIKEILERYGGNFPPKYGGNTNNATALLNEKIKTLCRLAGIDRLERGKIYDKDQKRFIHGIFPFWRIASSHICRRSFASNHYGKVPTPIIMSITGHKEEKTFLNYIGIDDSTLSEMIFEYWNR